MIYASILLGISPSSGIQIFLVNKIPKILDLNSNDLSLNHCLVFDDY